ncbi:MAG: preprotein translocase subunit YajC [Chitinophagales bacterium]
MGEGLASFLPLILMAVVVYFFFIRPQSKQKKEMQSLLDDIKKGDKLVTAGGIHGKVFRNDGDIIVLEIDTNTKMKVETSSISLEMTKKAREAKKAELIK